MTAVESVYGATSPVAGLTFKPADWVRLYASFGQGFQTPLGSELAYRPPTWTSGLNFDLRPARSNNTEFGVKIDIDPDITAQFAVFQALTRQEIVVDTNIGGRSTYQNSGRTRRQGAEYSLNYRIAPEWRFQLAYTYVDAHYSDAYLTCVAAPCAGPDCIGRRRQPPARCAEKQCLRAASLGRGSGLARERERSIRI